MCYETITDVKDEKYFLILLLACSLTVQTGAQDAAAMQRMQELNKLMQSMSQQIRKAFDKKDYVLVAELNYQGISMVDSNHDFLRSVTGGDRQVEAIKGYFYYDLACSYSRRGMNEGALYHLGRAVACDYNDWKHILEDHDLDNIRNDARMDSLIDVIRNRATTSESCNKRHPTRPTSGAIRYLCSPTNRPVTLTCNASRPTSIWTRLPARAMRFPRSRM